MNWKRILACNHEWTNYWDVGKCATPYCSWHEQHCKKCRVYSVECDCGSMTGMNGEPFYKVIRKDYTKHERR